MGVADVGRMTEGILCFRDAPWEVGLSETWREARGSPLIPPGSPSQREALLHAQFLAELKRKSVGVGRVSHFLPAGLWPNEGACRASVLSWNYSLPHGRVGGSGNA